MQIKWSRKAKEQASEIVEFISQDNPTAAYHWMSEIMTLVKTIPLNPFKGRVVPEIENSVYREILRGHYRVIYRVSDRYIFIVTIHHCRRLLTTLEESD